MSIRWEWRPNALYDVRRDPAVVAETDALAEQIAERANADGEGTYVTGSQQGRRAPQGRWRSTVVTGDYKAMRDNARTNRLIRSM